MLARYARFAARTNGGGARDDTAAGPLPRQKRPFWRVPAVLLDWQFAPAWPRLAALAGCAAIGFMVGIAGVDAPIARRDGAGRNRDIGAMVFEPESLRGAAAMTMPSSLPPR